ncbi:TPA: sigma-70 family RNA polymerase sigma factor [Candidatus Poribacteria bacterium]|nr:sigma-70 family RNA polymerase sigma factor [Candidatus Poribacteria bacterium]
MEEFVTDTTLIENLLEGDVEALGVLFERYKRMVYSVAYRITRSHHDAGDVTQETFIKVFKSISRFRGESNVETWIYRIAVNSALNHLRKMERRREEPLDEVPEGEIPPTNRPSDDPERCLERNELRRAISQAMRRLSPEHRAVVVLHDVEGLTHTEISKILGCSEGTVKSRLHHARRRLRRILKPLLDTGV